MIDFFTIFSKGGIVLWCFRGTQDAFETPVNLLIKNVFLQVTCPMYYIHDLILLHMHIQAFKGIKYLHRFYTNCTIKPRLWIMKAPLRNFFSKFQLAWSLPIPSEESFPGTWENRIYIINFVHCKLHIYSWHHFFRFRKDRMPLPMRWMGSSFSTNSIMSLSLFFWCVPVVVFLDANFLDEMKIIHKGVFLVIRQQCLSCL